MKVTVIDIVIVMFGTIPKGLKKFLVDLEINERVDVI